MEVCSKVFTKGDMFRSADLEKKNVSDMESNGIRYGIQCLSNVTFVEDLRGKCLSYLNQSNQSLINLGAARQSLEAPLRAQQLGEPGLFPHCDLQVVPSPKTLKDISPCWYSVNGAPVASCQSTYKSSVACPPSLLATDKHENDRECLIRTSRRARSVPFQTSQEAICSRKHLQFNACERVELKFPGNTSLTTRKRTKDVEFRWTWKEGRPLKGSEQSSGDGKGTHFHPNIHSCHYIMKHHG
ncbi:hypothetical protein CEXT_696381 [Caerostris extrusa]|uniref:Uncharacterized protein n=1 Tax=Caerostris extrusa TaxID=172846 RepID=A0AAV4YBI8_CAEEX|nr:hypothetical protein CEXT_696381 [Caerostris extrusa]